MNTIFKLILTATMLTALPAVAGTDEVRTAESVDLEKYMGHWYEIAAIEQPFEKGCFAVQAHYTLRANGRVDVVNSCRRGALDGPLTQALGVARSVDESNAKLKVSFSGRTEGDYWILDVANDYSYALVGTPDRGALWILARGKSLEREVFDGLIAKARALGFAVDQVRLMKQES